MRVQVPSGNKLLFCLLVLVFMLLEAAGSYEMKWVPVTDPSFQSHARASIHLSPAATGVMVVAIIVMVMGRRKDNQLKRRARHGLCLQCGYGLRATPGRCPECGMLLEGRSCAVVTD